MGKILLDREYFDAVKIFFSGGYVTVKPIVLVDIVGIEKLSDAFGVLIIFVGVATAIGTLIVGDYLIDNFD